MSHMISHVNAKKMNLWLAGNAGLNSMPGPRAALEVFYEAYAKMHTQYCDCNRKTLPARPLRTPRLPSCVGPPPSPQKPGFTAKISVNDA